MSGPSLREFVSTRTFDQIKAELSDAPYYCKVKERNGLYLVKYHNQSAVRKYRVCQDARGIILEKQTHQVVCQPFSKFFNARETGCAAPIDWSQAIVQEKLDGSLMKYFTYQGEGCWASMSCIDAREAEIKPGVTLYTLTQSILSDSQRHWLTHETNPDWTYMFELTHPDNRVVVEHVTGTLTLLACFDNVSGEEQPVPSSSPFPRPQMYTFQSQAECEAAAETLPVNQEGFVVVQGSHRIKIKGRAYLSAHGCIGAQPIDDSKLLQLILTHQDDDVQFRPDVMDRLHQIQLGLDRVRETWRTTIHSLIPIANARTRGDIARTMKEQRVSTLVQSWAFTYLYPKEPHGLTPSDWLETHGLPSSSLQRLLDEINLKS